MALQLGCHYNVTAVIALLMLVLCLYFMTHRYLAVKVIAALLFLIHLFVCQLANSRTVFVTGLIVFPFFLFCFVWNRFADKNLRIRILTGIIAAGIGLLFYWYSRPFSFFLFEKGSHYNEVVLNADNKNTVSKPSENIRGLESNLNGRGKIWTYCLKTMMHDPYSLFFGVTSVDVTDSLINLGGFTWRVAHAHNAILQIGIASGLPAMIAYILFLVCVCLKSLKLFFFGRHSFFSSLFVIPIMILSFILPGMTETFIVSYQSVCFVFILLSGWVVVLADEQKINRNELRIILNQKIAALKKQ